MRDKSELYLQALGLLDVRAGEALAFEDSPPGVGAAKKAGLRCIAIPNEVTREAGFDDADLVLRSLADKSVRAVIAAASDGSTIRRKHDEPRRSRASELAG